MSDSTTWKCEPYEHGDEFIDLRKSIETVDPLRFNALLGAISRVVLSDPTYYFQTYTGGTKTYRTPDQQPLMGNKTDVIEEIDGPTRTADSRMMDTRLFTKEHILRKSLGIVAFVGMDWKTTPHLSDMNIEDKLPQALETGGLLITSDFGKINTLWVLSSDNRDHWVTSYYDPRSITDFEHDQIMDDLTAYPTV